MSPPDLAIRRAEPADFEALWRSFQDASVYGGTLQVPYPSKEVWRKRIAEVPESDYLLVAHIGEELVGHGGLHLAGKSPRRQHAMMVALTVAAKFQNRGIGQKIMGALIDLADNWLNVFRLELTVFTDNAAAIAVYRKFGFEIEGTHRAYALRDGQYADTHTMARIRRKP